MEQQTNLPGYVKDDSTGLVINKNNRDLEIYRMRKAQVLKQRSLEERVSLLEAKIARLESKE